MRPCLERAAVGGGEAVTNLRTKTLGKVIAMFTVIEEEARKSVVKT